MGLHPDPARVDLESPPDVVRTLLRIDRPLGSETTHGCDPVVLRQQRIDEAECDRRSQRRPDGVRSADVIDPPRLLRDARATRPEATEHPSQVSEILDPPAGRRVVEVDQPGRPVTGAAIDVLIPRSSAVVSSTNHGVPLLQDHARDPAAALRRLVERLSPKPRVVKRRRGFQGRHRAAA